MKKIIAFTLSILCVMLLLIGCSGSSKLVGVWSEIDGDGILYFAEDNSGLSAKVAYTSESFDYEEKDDTLTFIAENTVETSYSVDNDRLTVTVDGTDYLYEKVRLSESEIDEYLADNGIEIKDPPKWYTSDETTSDETTSDDTSGDGTGNGSDTPSDEEIAEAIIGAWRGGDDTLMMVYFFYEDGTGLAGIFPFTYSVSDGMISMTIDFAGKTVSGTAKYEISGDCIYVDDGEGDVFVAERVDMDDLDISQ